MKKYFYTFLFTVGLTTLTQLLPAQIFSVGADGLTLKSGTVLCADSLILTPSADFSIASVTLSKNATAFNTPTQTYIRRVYRFSATTPVFSGISVINYVEGAELNDIAEANLVANVHNGTQWDALAGTVDVANNTVTTSITSKALNELTLASVAAPLPLNWLSFTATRQSSQVLLDWKTANEQNTKDFTVQFSTEGIKWNDLVKVPRNTISSNVKTYSYAHLAPVRGVNYYRILQTDVDARSSHSAVRTVKFAVSTEVFYVLGNPVTNGSLQVQVNSATPLVLYSAEGKLLQQINATPGLQLINVRGYSKGLYLLKGNNNSAKIIIQ